MDDQRLAEIEAKIEQARECDRGGTPADMARLTALAMDMLDKDATDLVAEVRRLNVLVDTMSGAVLDLANLLEDE